VRALPAIGFVTLLMAGVADAQILKQEPAMGALREGQTVMVDDGSCPKGEIKLVTGGNHRQVGGTKDIRRTTRCIPRPKQ
jgi:uncharacterized protein DUF6719